MKTATILKLKKKVFIVELPEEYHYHVNKKGICIQGLDKSDWTVFKGSFFLLGKPDEIKEEDAEKLVDIFDMNYYVDYNHPSRGAYTHTATESLLSAIESVIFWENPYREKIFVNMDISASMVRAANREIYSEKWHEAQEKTFDRSRSIILLVKN